MAEIKNQVGKSSIKKGVGNVSVKKQMKVNAPRKKLNFNFKLNSNLKELLKNKRVIIAGVIVLAILVTIIVIIVNLLNRTRYDNYYKYAKKVEDYGYNVLYNNKKTETTDKVTRIEVIKMAIASALNTTDISSYMYEQYNLYPDELWGEYAEKMGILGDFDINETNYNDEIEYITAITYFKNAKDKLLPEKGAKDTDKKIANIKDYSLDEQKAIKDLVGYEIIKEADGDIRGKQIVFKGQINELVVNFVWNLNTITLSSDDRLNINPNNVPVNVEDYPYILADVNKNIYEIPFKENKVFAPAKPVEVFSKFNSKLLQIDRFADEYFEYLLNIDYKTIDAKAFKNNLDFYVLKDFDEEEINEYVNYVKENEIIIKTEARTIMPAIYFDGASYRIRVELKVKIINSKTKDNLFLNDKNITYNNKEYTMYVDYELENSGFNETIYFDFDRLYNNIVNDVDISNN